MIITPKSCLKHEAKIKQLATFNEELTQALIHLDV